MKIWPFYLIVVFFFASFSTAFATEIETCAWLIFANSDEIRADYQTYLLESRRIRHLLRRVTSLEYFLPRTDDPVNWADSAFFFHGRDIQLRYSRNFLSSLNNDADRSAFLVSAVQDEVWLSALEPDPIFTRTHQDAVAAVIAKLNWNQDKLEEWFAARLRGEETTAMKNWVNNRKPVSINILERALRRYLIAKDISSGLLKARLAMAERGRGLGLSSDSLYVHLGKTVATLNSRAKSRRARIKAFSELHAISHFVDTIDEAKSFTSYWDDAYDWFRRQTTQARRELNQRVMAR